MTSHGCSIGDVSSAHVDDLDVADSQYVLFDSGCIAVVVMLNITPCGCCWRNAEHGDK